MGLRTWFNPKAARDMALRKTLAALHEVADYTAARAVDYAPVDTAYMARHIRVEELGGGLGFRVVVAATYAVFVHEGHMSRGGNWVPGRPFVDWALADARREWPSIAARQAASTGGAHNPEGFLSTTFTT